MPTLVLTDLHGNLPALEAVLAHPAAAQCTDIISMGDHVNFGPDSRAMHERLVSLGATMLLGNHEERLRHADDAQFDGYNWRLMRFTAAQMQGADLDLPLDVQRGSVLFTHGTPGQPYHLVQPDEVHRVLDELPEDVTLLLSGHNHTPWDVTHHGKRAVNPGSTGMYERAPGSDEVSTPGTAPFLVLEGTSVTRYEAYYPWEASARAFIASGAHLIAPELCRGVLHVIRTGEPQGAMRLVQHVNAYAAQNGLDSGSEAAWKLADRTFSWPEPLTSEEFWTQMENAL